MNLLLDSNAKVSAIAIIALAAAVLLRRQSAAVRHWILSVAILCAIATPVLGIIVPSWHVEVSPLAPARGIEPSPQATSTTTFALGAVPENARESIAAGTPPAPRYPIGRVMVATWLSGTVIALLILLVGQMRLMWLAATAAAVTSGRWARLVQEISAELGVRRPVALLESHHPTLLATWGIVRPKIIVPSAALHWSEERSRIVLRHELAHVQRGDWLVLVAAAILRAVYWFNPLAWILSARARQESEHACDDLVIGGGVDGSDYAAHLLDLARILSEQRRGWLPAAAMARASSLEGRITAMLNARLNRTPVSRPARLVTAVALLSFAASIAGFAAQNTFYTLSGTVMDPMNRVLPRTTLILVNGSSEAKHEVKTDASGHFEFVGLPAGEYALEVRFPGFSSFKDKVVIIGRDINRTVTLRVGSLEETITVKGSPTPEQTREQQVKRQEQLARVAEKRQAQLDNCKIEAASVAGGKIVPPLRLTNVNPDYPDQLKGSNTAGTVVMEAIIGTDGDIRDVKAIKSDHPAFEIAAIEAVRQWKFTQTLLNCVPIEVPMTVTTRFAGE
jgi:TonB family protein